MACTRIITEDGKFITTESGVDLVTEDSICPGGAGGDELVFVGTIHGARISSDPHVGGF